MYSENKKQIYQISLFKSIIKNQNLYDIHLYDPVWKRIKKAFEKRNNKRPK